jgi:hypothetical protein
MPDTIKMGTILIKEGTLLPELLRFESEPCAPGWRLVKNLAIGCRLNQSIGLARVNGLRQGKMIALIKVETILNL